jgi:hypothetical protein
MVYAPLVDAPRGGFQPAVHRVLCVFLISFRSIHLIVCFWLHQVWRTVRELSADGPPGVDGPGVQDGRSILKRYEVATLAQNKIFLAKQELLLSEITGLPLDAQMQRNCLDVDERVEGSRQCSCSRPS